MLAPATFHLGLPARAYVFVHVKNKPTSRPTWDQIFVRVYLLPWHRMLKSIWCFGKFPLSVEYDRMTICSELTPKTPRDTFGSVIFYENLLYLRKRHSCHYKNTRSGPPLSFFLYITCLLFVCFLPSNFPSNINFRNTTCVMAILLNTLTPFSIAIIRSLPRSPHHLSHSVILLFFAQICYLSHASSDTDVVKTNNINQSANEINVQSACVAFPQSWRLENGYSRIVWLY